MRRKKNGSVAFTSESGRAYYLSNCRIRSLVLNRDYDINFRK